MTGTSASVATKSGLRPAFVATAVTDGSGNATFNFPAGLFSVPPVVTAQIQTAAGTDLCDFRITTLTNLQCVINVKHSTSIAVALLGLTILLSPVNLVGVTMHVIAAPAGTTP